MTKAMTPDSELEMLDDDDHRAGNTNGFKKEKKKENKCEDDIDGHSDTDFDGGEEAD